MNRDILLLLTFTAFGGLISIVIGLYYWRIMSKIEADETERKRLYNDIKYYHEKYREDEDEIDMLKEEIRKLKLMNTDIERKEINKND